MKNKRYYILGILIILLVGSIINIIIFRKYQIIKEVDVAVMDELCKKNAVIGVADGVIKAQAELLLIYLPEAKYTEEVRKYQEESAEDGLLWAYNEDTESWCKRNGMSYE